MSRSTPRPTTPSAMDSTVLDTGPVAPHLTGRPAAEHLAPHEHVGEGVDVGGQQAVDVEGQVVAGRLVPGDPVAVPGIARGQHVVLHRVGVLGQGLGGQIVGQADRLRRSRPGRAAAARRASVRWLRAPRWSSAPQRPQFFRATRTWHRARRWSGPRTRSPWAQLVIRPGGARSSPRPPCRSGCPTNRSSESTWPGGHPGRAAGPGRRRPGR